MHLYGDTMSRSISDNAKISAKKAKLESSVARDVAVAVAVARCVFLVST
jgi:hypothetical protein